MGGWGNQPLKTTQDFKLEVAKGNVPGHALLTFLGVKEVIDTTESTLWDIAGDFTWPTGDEAWEIVSDSVNDDFGGTGANVAIITGLDSNFLRVTEFINMDGTTPVPTVRTDWNRIESIAAVFSGSLQRNDGIITLRVLSAGAVRSTMLAGNAASFNGFFTVPDDKWFFGLTIASFSPKGEDVNVRSPLMFDGTNTWISAGVGPTYQNTSFLYEQAHFPFPPKTSREIRVDSTNPSITGAVALEVLEVDKTMVNL